MTITAGKLRGLTQPTIMLRMDSAVAEAPGEGDRIVFGKGLIVLAQYVGNGRLILTPLDPGSGYSSHVVMASALNSTASIVEGRDVAHALGVGLKDVDLNTGAEYRNPAWMQEAGSDQAADNWKQSVTTTNKP